MKLNTNPLKKKYPIIIRVAGFTGIILLILVFVVFPRFINESEFSKVKEVEIDTIDINYEKLNRKAVAFIVALSY